MVAPSVRGAGVGEGVGEGVAVFVAEAVGVGVFVAVELGLGVALGLGEELALGDGVLSGRDPEPAGQGEVAGNWPMTATQATMVPLAFRFTATPTHFAGQLGEALTIRTPLPA